MGQARIRGTYEERRNAAVAKKLEDLDKNIAFRMNDEYNKYIRQNPEATDEEKKEVQERIAAFFSATRNGLANKIIK